MATLGYLHEEAKRRENLRPIVAMFERECELVRLDLLGLAAGSGPKSAAEIRAHINALTMRLTTAAMTTAKGAGLMIDHPVARFCQQAFFFLVWSCPQSVAQTHLCELAGIEQSPAEDK